MMTSKNTDNTISITSAGVDLSPLIPTTYAVPASTFLYTPAGGGVTQEDFSGVDGYIYLSPSAQYDSCRTYCVLKPATYSFQINIACENASGSVVLYLYDPNNTLLGTFGSIDMYHASGTDYRLRKFSGTLTVATAGRYKIVLSIDSKNASSSGYNFIFKQFNIIPIS